MQKQQKFFNVGLQEVAVNLIIVHEKIFVKSDRDFSHVFMPLLV